MLPGSAEELMARFNSDKLQSLCDEVAQQLEWKIHIAVYRMEHDLPKITAKIDELEGLMLNCDKAETKHIIDKAEFKGMNIVSHGDKSVFIVESLGGY